jgi:hypothetical protein
MTRYVLCVFLRTHPVSCLHEYGNVGLQSYLIIKACLCYVSLMYINVLSLKSKKIIKTYLELKLLISLFNILILSLMYISVHIQDVTHCMFLVTCSQC